MLNDNARDSVAPTGMSPPRPNKPKRPPKVYRNLGVEGIRLPGSAVKPVPPDHNEITALAYRLWSERGGDAMENWLEAEQRLTQPKST